MYTKITCTAHKRVVVVVVVVVCRWASSFDRLPIRVIPRRPIPADSQSASDCQHRDATTTTVNILLIRSRSMVIADVPPFLQCPQVSPSVSFVTGMSDAPSPATNAGLILIWLQRRAVSPPRLSLALAPCVAHRHRCLSSLFNRYRSSRLRVPSFFDQCHSLSLPFPFLSPSFSFTPVRPTFAHRGVAWYTMRYNPLPPFSRQGFPLRPPAIVHANIAGEERIVTMARSIW